MLFPPPQTIFAAQAGMSPAQYREELSVVEALTDLVDPSRRAGGASAEQVAAVQVAQFDTPLSYASDSEQFMGMALKALAEVPTRVNFCKQRVDKATKLAALGAAVGEKMLADSKWVLWYHVPCLAGRHGMRGQGLEHTP